MASPLTPQTGLAWDNSRPAGKTSVPLRERADAVVRCVALHVKRNAAITGGDGGAGLYLFLIAYNDSDSLPAYPRVSLQTCLPLVSSV